MIRISSRRTFFDKRIAPLIFFLGVFGFMASGIAFRSADQGVKVETIITSTALGTLGFFLMKKLVFPLADEATDAGDAIIVRRGSLEERIPFANVTRVRYLSFVEHRVTLYLREPGVLGDRVSFVPPRGRPFSRHPAITDLIKRIGDAAGSV